MSFCSLQKSLIIFSLLFVFSCSDKKKEYDKTKAVSAFAIIDPIKIDPALEKAEIILPKQKANSFWNGSSSEQNQRIENFAKDFSVSKSFFSGTKKIALNDSTLFWSGFGNIGDDDFVFEPIINGDKIYTLNTAGKLIAYDLTTHKKLWKNQIFLKKFLKNYRSPKIYYSKSEAGEKIFAVAGVNKIAAVNASDGKVLWSKDIASIPVSTPVSDGKMVFVTTNDNKLYALSAKDGELQWTISAILRNTAILGAADPVFYKDQIIASFSSGEIYAINKKTGELIWSQDLNLNKANSSDFYLNDVDATPVIKGDKIYLIGNGGLMMALDLKTGNYLWRKEIAGITDFWAAGEFLFVIDNGNKILAISQKTGGIKWISQLPNFKKEKKPESKFNYNGVIMAGDKLLISRFDGQLFIVSPFDGKIEKSESIGKRIYHAPIVIKGKIYFHNLGGYVVDVIEVE
ncbi:MAG: hypothetical protein EBS06_02605 [Proteobacteria bacterium]|nr:hypothetical protein [Pseudomonadota bacterium]